MPPAPDRPPEPSALHEAFERNGPLDWGENSLSTADIAHLHGTDAAWRSLWLLERAAIVEPNVTAQFLESLPPTASAHELAKRVKSPVSLARKIRDWSEAERRFPIDDVLRYTVLTETPADLVAAARHTVDELGDHGWRVTYAMQSYTDGSRYKGIHAYLASPEIAQAEVQFHSVASAKVKELTTRWYEIERSATATPEERAAARQRCVDLSGTLRPPEGISDLKMLGGKRVAVKNYSDSRDPVDQRGTLSASTTRRAAHPTALDKHDGIAR
ncbi:hypothetical protein AB0F43_15420 [Kribbella sp. NPDC023972]|uniref:hypothetical protein n=1 Tax=Kribbella sp. NPDC023972 TaxID=3154795 RepID=UPI0033E7F3A7